MQKTNLYNTQDDLESSTSGSVINIHTLQGDSQSQVVYLVSPTLIQIVDDFSEFMNIRLQNDLEVNKENFLEVAITTLLLPSKLFIQYLETAGNKLEDCEGRILANKLLHLSTEDEARKHDPYKYAFTGQVSAVPKNVEEVKELINVMQGRLKHRYIETATKLDDTGNFDKYVKNAQEVVEFYKAKVSENSKKGRDL